MPFFVFRILLMMHHLIASKRFDAIEFGDTRRDI
jgi:hypothetical protein